MSLKTLQAYWTFNTIRDGYVELQHCFHVSFWGSHIHIYFRCRRWVAKLDNVSNKEMIHISQTIKVKHCFGFFFFCTKMLLYVCRTVCWQCYITIINSANCWNLKVSGMTNEYITSNLNFIEIYTEKGRKGNLGCR